MYYLFITTNAGIIMKYFIFTLTLGMACLFAKDNTSYIKVSGMQCSYSCAGKVNTVVNKIEGVKDCSVDFEKGIATVVYDDKKLKTGDIMENLRSNTAYTVSEVKVEEDKKESAQI